MNISGKWLDCWRNDSIDKTVYSNGDFEFSDNQIQNSFSVMLATLLIELPDSSTNGILYLAFGRGDEAWDYFTPDQSHAQTTLTDEFYRVSVMDTVRTASIYNETSLFYYIDPDTHEVSGTPTNAIEAKIFVAKGIADGIHREFGLFGINATSTKDSGHMINWVIVPAFDKTGYELTRTVRLIFRSK